MQVSGAIESHRNKHATDRDVASERASLAATGSGLGLPTGDVKL